MVMGEGYLIFYIVLVKYNGSFVIRVGDCEGIIDEIICFGFVLSWESS